MAMDWTQIVAGLVGIAAGTIVTAFVRVGRNRVRTLPYTLETELIGLTDANPAYGQVEVRYQGQLVPNLFRMTITLENDSTLDITELHVFVQLPVAVTIVNESVQILGNNQIVRRPEDFDRFVTAPTGGALSQEVQLILAHRREYVIDVLNREDKVGCCRFGGHQPKLLAFARTLPG